MTMNDLPEFCVQKTDTEWQAELTPLEYSVLRQAGTEPPGSGDLLHCNTAGVYHCRACDASLFTSTTKFNSFCGWPSFFAPESTAVIYVEDRTLAQPRVEVRCASCGSHLGHVFPDAPQTPTGNRYCINSVCLTFKPSDMESE